MRTFVLSLFLALPGCVVCFDDGIVIDFGEDDEDLSAEYRMWQEEQRRHEDLQRKMERRRTERDGRS